MANPRLDIMQDVETLGNKNSPVIIQISAVSCNLITGEVYKEFNVLVNPQSCVKKGLNVNGDTVEWWLSQENTVVKKVFCEAVLNGIDIDEALKLYSKFLKDEKERVLKETKSKYLDLKMWGNGLLADNKWLESAYDACSIELPWKYNENEDVRTLVDLGIACANVNPKKEIVFKGEKHNAIDDCKYQIEYCHAIFKALMKNKEPSKG